MNEFTKNYSEPKVPYQLYSFIAKQIDILTPVHHEKNMLLVSLQYICYAVVLAYFAIDMIYMNIVYVNFFQSFTSLGVIFQIILQVIIGVLHFVIHNFHWLIIIYTIGFISNIYSIQRN